jgi:hypothetical protein
MILQHFSDKPVALKQMFNVPVALQYAVPFGKPRGFWVSVKGEDDWPNWCQSEDFNSHRLAVCHRVEIDYSKILVIDNPEKFLKFEHDFCAAIQGFTCIRWGKVAAEYSGIIIVPYFYNYRFNSSWYYGWDCASGCIWVAKDVVKNITVEKKHIQ